MTAREKLIELLESAESAVYWDSTDKGFIQKIADNLLVNGVTFQKWIPVSERLPEVRRAVIVWTELHEIGEAQYNGKHFEWIDDDGGYCFAQVTHWMPLPEPPKEDAK